ncbi:MAG: hypothetical protein GXY07_19280 [Candidatus Hydrogenedentes bacterium]|nr:hypothetical protein [Candidatus Hydrogenedentota bacterium]
MSKLKRAPRGSNRGTRRNPKLYNLSIITQRVLNVKLSLPPILFFLDEIQRFEPKRESGWINSGLCPFHNDRNVGSFSVNLDSGAFHCFSCGAAGADIIAFYRLKYCCDFMTALRDLEGGAGICQR